MLDSPAIAASSLSHVFLLCSALILVIFFLAQKLNAGGELGLLLWSRRIESDLGKAVLMLPSTEQRDTGSFLPSGWVSILGSARWPLFHSGSHGSAASAFLALSSLDVSRVWSCWNHIKRPQAKNAVEGFIQPGYECCWWEKREQQRFLSHHCDLSLKKKEKRNKIKEVPFTIKTIWLSILLQTPNKFQIAWVT